jgi:hypothetical protein
MGALVTKIEWGKYRLMLNLSNGDTSTCTKAVSPLIKIGVADSIGHHFEGQRNPGNIY